ncbi:hypothetical protein D0T84_19330 [Dysgonomonas sp. 521]|uniref:YncE family protein n=1 Tax=Dysgonomonas sp. 521 TaxID=2302932 RepID=UPI0013D7A642|nr:DUF5074 domain-containing protein [Dysgonomonas sp. 521]NDV97041.1 hypothetical protein [Dysgonomonas sp. 521]
MKLNKFFYAFLFVSLVLGFASCSDDDGYPVVEPPVVGTGSYILNSGKSGSNNSNIAYYDYETGKLTYDIFKSLNNKELGDTGQDIITYKNRTYVAVYGSAVIYVLDKEGKILKEIESTKNGQKQQPRNLTAYDGWVYVTYFDGYLAKINPNTLEIEAQVAVGRNPEYVRASKGKLYVANSGGLDYNTAIGYDKTVSVVDVETFTEDKKIEVVLNPDKIAVDNKGNIFVISNGNYIQTRPDYVPNKLQRIDAETQKVTEIGNATYMTVCDDKLYTIYSQWDANGSQEIIYNVYNTNTGTKLSDSFITDGTIVSQPFCISSDPVKKYIYIGSSDYKSNGDMYVFGTDGKLITKFDTGGLNPMTTCPTVK